MLERYKDLIGGYIAPHEPWKDSQQVSIKNAKKVLSNYRKATNDKVGLIDLMVHYVECGTDFICQFGDMYEQYYSSLESVFEGTLKLMKQYQPQEVQRFVTRLAIVVKKAKYVGWGYYDSINDMFCEAYPDDVID